MPTAIVASICGAVTGGIISWLVSRRSRVVERRYAIYLIAEGIVGDLRCVACAYWRSDGRDLNQEAAIKQQMERLDAKIEAIYRGLGRDCWDNEVIDCVNELDDAATGGLFESQERSADGSRAANIKRACEDLLDCLYKRAT